jgi:hypothetical protein
MKAGIADPEKNALLGNGRVNTFPLYRITTQQKRNYWKRCFVTMLYKENLRDKWLSGDSIPCGGRIEYLHRSPASRRRRRKGKSRIWDSKIWSRVPWDSDPRMTALARTSSNCKRQTHSLVRESAPHQQTRNCLTVIKIWSWSPDGCFIPRQTGRLTVGRNIRLRLRSD